MIIEIIIIIVFIINYIASESVLPMTRSSVNIVFYLFRYEFLSFLYFVVHTCAIHTFFRTLKSFYKNGRELSPKKIVSNNYISYFSSPMIIFVLLR